MPKKKLSLIYGISLLVFLGIFFLAVMAGTLAVTVNDFTSIFHGNPTSTMEYVIKLRFPRIFAAILVGAALATSGLFLQLILKNPLADPSIVGINSGALIVKVLILLTAPQWYLTSDLLSFLGGLGVLLFLAVLGMRYRFNPLKILIIGIAVNAILNALLDLAEIFPSLTISLGFNQLTWSDVKILLLVIPILICLAFVGRFADIMRLNEELIISLGVSIRLTRFLFALASALLASLCTAIVGNLAFVGLLIPHMASRLVGNQFRYLYPLSIILGASLMLLSDTLGRTLVLPLEIPASAILAFVGGPFLIYLIQKDHFK